MKGSFGLFGMTPSSRSMVVCGVRGATLASSDVYERPAPVIVSKVFFNSLQQVHRLALGHSPSATLVIGRSSNLHRRDRLDLKQEIGMGEPAQDT